MSRKKAVFIVLMSLLVPCVAQCRKKGHEINPEALLARARSEEILWTKGTPPTAMRAQIQVADIKGRWLTGEYRFDWASPSQWREEIRFANYDRLRIGNEEGYWQTSTVSYQPAIIVRIDQLLHLKRVFELGSDERLGKVKSRKIDGAVNSCTDFRAKTGTERVLCFDATTGLLLSADYPLAERGNPSDISRIEYGAFKQVGGKSIAGEIKGFCSRKLAFVLVVTELDTPAKTDPALFERPPNAELWRTCDDVTNVHLTRSVSPNFPRRESMDTVELYFVVGANGLPSHMTVIQGTDREMVAAAVAAVDQWQFKPAMCGQEPVPVEIETSFTIRPY